MLYLYLDFELFLISFKFNFVVIMCVIWIHWALSILCLQCRLCIGGNVFTMSRCWSCCPDVCPVPTKTCLQGRQAGESITQIRLQMMRVFFGFLVFFCVLYRFDEGYIIYLVRVLFWRNHPSPVIENVWAMMIVWRMTGKIIGTVPSCIVNDSCAQSYAGTWPLSSCCR